MLVFLGLDNAGKTSIKVYLETLDIEKAKQTKMSDKVEVYQRGNMRIEIFPGQKVLRYNEKLYEVFFPFVRRIAFIVDAADQDRFDEAKEYWEFIKKMIKKYCKEIPEVILVAHKQDLQNAVPADQIAKYILSKNDLKTFRIVAINTSIYDPISMSLLLKVLHGAHRLGIDRVVEVLRERTDSDVAFIYDNHLLPIAISLREKDEKIINRLTDVVISLERLGEIKVLYGTYADGKNILLLSEHAKEERIIIGVYGFTVNLKEVLIHCKATQKHYLAEMRRRLWSSL